MIHTSRLISNLEVLREPLPAGVGVCAAVKADAYGHGALIVAPRLIAAGVSHLAVATVEEGVELRRSGVKTPLVLYGALQDDEWRLAAEIDLQPLISSLSQIQLLAEASRQVGRASKVHLKVDTGMGRLGCSPDAAAELAREIVHSLWLEFEGLCTHLASSEADGPVSVSSQLALFAKVKAELDALGFAPRYLHAANSGGILFHPDSIFNLVRPGISLYGYPPSPQRAVSRLQPVLEWVSRVAYVKTVPAGTPLSYGSRYFTQRQTDVATIPVGYADGYRRSFTNAAVLVNGRPHRVSGTVCMDQFLVDLGPDSGVAVGDEVTLMGGDLHAVEKAPSADDLAEQAGTISYEILCGISRRVPRIEVPGPLVK